MNYEKELIKRYKKYISSHNIEFNYLEEFETFSSSVLRHTRPLLIEYNTTFHFERKGNKREGALTQREIRDITIEGRSLLSRVVKIQRGIEFSLQIHTYFHELTHMINNHIEQEKNDIQLTTAQKEYVAEVTAQSLIYTFCGGMLVDELPDNGKFDQTTYIEAWINGAQFSKEKIDEMWRQIEFAYSKISAIILENKKI